MDGEIPWFWILWILAVVMAVGSLVRLSMTLRDRLQAKLDEYFKSEVTAMIRKKRILAETKRRHEIARKLLEDRQAMETEK